MNDDARHHEKMAKKKAARDKIMATKTEERGLVIVHTGKGKGKSSAAFGMIFRCIAHGMPCAVVQFIKGAHGHRRARPDPGAFRRPLRSSTPWARASPGRPRTGPATWRRRAAAWEMAKELIRDPANRMVLLDEINIALRYDYLDVDEVLAFLRGREAGDDACRADRAQRRTSALIEAADLVTEMELVKHPFRSGVKAQAGVEF